ncbi:MAG: NYN domain-containing protein [Candidatus Aminicenantes bacterium]|nr:MAG: NYN domain-containing protein [Candidatus Aminicenantes bacterium]
MTYLIDGNNYIGFTSSFNRKDPRSKYELVSKLLVFQQLKRTRVILVFDGVPDLNLLDERFQRKNFSVVFPPSGQNADSIIKEIILKQTDLRRFFVVSSDREIKNFAKAKRAHALSSKDFDRELKTKLREYKRHLQNEKRVSSPSPLEMNQWLEIFNNKK